MYNPTREAESLVASWNVDKTTNEIYIIGLGLGYHVTACLLRYPWIQRITVIECFSEVIQLLRQFVPERLEDPRIVIQLTEDAPAFRESIGVANILNVHMHPPSVFLMPFADIRLLLQEMQMLRTTTSNQATRLMENWVRNSPSINAGNVLTGRENSHIGQPGIIVAAGPSLDTSLEFVRNAESATVVSVSAALKTLLKVGIAPDYCIVSDSSWKISEHFVGIEEVANLPELLVLGTVFPEVVQDYRENVTWLLQRGFEPAETCAKDGGYDSFQTGGSVATLALSVLYYLGCDPIVFVGQDLAYVGGRTHGKGIHEDLGAIQKPAVSSITVESVNGKPIVSNISWNSFRHWIEHFIETHPDRTYLNVSSGAHIRGTLVAHQETLVGKQAFRERD